MNVIVYGNDPNGFCLYRQMFIQSEFVETEQQALEKVKLSESPRSLILNSVSRPVVGSPCFEDQINQICNPKDGERILLGCLSDLGYKLNHVTAGQLIDGNNVNSIRSWEVLIYNPADPNLVCQRPKYFSYFWTLITWFLFGLFIIAGIIWVIYRIIFRKRNHSSMIVVDPQDSLPSSSSSPPPPPLPMMCVEDNGCGSTKFNPFQNDVCF